MIDSNALIVFASTFLSRVHNSHTLTFSKSSVPILVAFLTFHGDAASPISIRADIGSRASSTKVWTLPKTLSVLFILQRYLVSQRDLFNGSNGQHIREGVQTLGLPIHAHC